MCFCVVLLHRFTRTLEGIGFPITLRPSAPERSLPLLPSLAPPCVFLPPRRGSAVPAPWWRRRACWTAGGSPRAAGRRRFDLRTRTDANSSATPPLGAITNCRPSRFQVGVLPGSRGAAESFSSSACGCDCFLLQDLLYRGESFLRTLCFTTLLASRRVQQSSQIYNLLIMFMNL